MDSFYKVLSPEQHEAAARNEYNFDHPDAFDFALLVKTLKRLKAGKRVEVPIYNFVTHRRETKTVSMYGKHRGISAQNRQNFKKIKHFKNQNYKS